MQIFINNLAEDKIDNLICSDMDRFASSVVHDMDCLDIHVVSVQSFIVTPETITFIFENNNSFVANIPQDCYHKIEVL